MKRHSAIVLILALFVRDSLANCSLVLAFYTIILQYFFLVSNEPFFTLLMPLMVSLGLKVAGHFDC